MIFKEHIKDVGFRPFFSGSELRDLGINPKSTGKGFLYTWNANGSLRSVTDLKGVTYRFRYDAFGRRLEKRRMASTFRFVWDGNVLLHETFKKDNSENTELTTWVFEGFVPTAKLVNGKAYSIISDHLGTPILAIDSEGNEVWNRQLDIYGRVKREIKASSLGDDVRPFIPFLYQGQYYDFETNLAYNRFRYYSPETGTYINQDPIGLAGGNPNLYGYVYNSIGEIDLFGLNPLRNNLINSGMGMDNVSWQAHHLIPNQVWKEKASFFSTIGFSGQHESSNGIALPNSQQGALQEKQAFYHNGSHPIYYQMILDRVNAIEEEYKEKIKEGKTDPNELANEAKKDLENLQKIARRLLGRKTSSNSCDRVS